MLFPVSTVVRVRSYQGMPSGMLQALRRESALNSLLTGPGFRYPAPKGASDFEELTASLKRCPDTKREFFGNASGAEAEDWGLRYL